MIAMKLTVGFGNRGYQLGTGVLVGWDIAYYWLRNVDVETLYWRPTELECPECGSPITSAMVPAPISVVIFRCPNGHKFGYENTD